MLFRPHTSHLARYTLAMLRSMLPPIFLTIPIMLLSLVPVTAVVADRESKCKQLLLMMGLDVRAYWLGQVWAWAWACVCACVCARVCVCMCVCVCVI